MHNSDSELPDMAMNLGIGSLGEVMPVGIIITELFPEYRIVYANDVFADMLGYSGPEDIRGRSALEFVHPDDIEREVANGPARNSTTDVYRTEYRAVRRDGRTIYVLQRSRHIVQPDGREHILASYTDITRERIEAAEKDNIINSIPGGVALYKFKNEEFTLVLCSDGVPGLTGHARDEYKALVAGDPMELVCAQDREIVKNSIKQILDTHKDDECVFRALHVDGHVVWTRANIHYMGLQDGFEYIHAVYHSISEETSVYETILNAYNAGVLIFDLDTLDIIYANEAAKLIAAADDKCYADQKCYSYMWGESERCADCNIKKLFFGDETTRIRSVAGKERYYFSEIKRINWYGRDVAAAFMTDITAHEQRRTALAKSERLLRQAIDSSAMLSFEYDIKNDMLVNENTVLCQAGYVSNQRGLPETQIADGYVAEESLEEYRALYTDIRRGVPLAKAKVWFNRDRNPEDRHCISLSYTVFCDANGVPERAVGLGLDITDREVQQQLHEKRIRLLTKSNPASLGSYIINLNRNCVNGQLTQYSYINKQAENTAYDAYLSAMHKNFPVNAEYDHYCDVFGRDSLMRMYGEGQNTVSYTHRFLFTNGIEKWITTAATLLQNPSSGDLEAYVFATDVTDKIINTMITQQMVNKDYDIVALIYPRRNKVEFMYVNNEYDGMAEINISNYNENRLTCSQELFDATQGEIYKQCTDMGLIVRQLNENGTYKFVNYRYVEGRRRIKNYSYAYLDKEHNTILCTVQDVTELYAREEAQIKAVQSALSEAERANAAKSDFLANMSHDIRTPMNAIINMTSLAMEDANDPAMLMDDLKKVDTSCRFLLSLINDILDMSKIDSGKMTLHPDVYFHEDFAAYIQSVFEPLCRDKNIEFSFTTQSELPLYVDRQRLNQVFFNLLSNAVKYTPEGGHVSYSVATHEDGRGNLECEFKISDDGCGMSKEFQQRMFEPFERESRTETAHNGTGLGLSIAKSTVELMGGTISVDSDVGKGTTFTIKMSLPEATDEQIQACNRQKNALAATNISGIRVLVAEDHPLNREILKRVLDKEGVLVDCTENGLECLDAFTNHPAGYYSVVLMDVRMPIMDGLEATREIRRLTKADAKNIPIIAMTANAFAEDRQASRDAGMSAHLSKPIDMQKLIACISGYIN